jgi:hypothetical protein
MYMARLKRCLPGAFVLLSVPLSACKTLPPPIPRYIVTAAPVDVSGGGYRMCIAVDPTDAQGVWWWEPGPSGCNTRTTGPTVFRAELARVTDAAEAGRTEAGFMLPLMSGPRNVRLVLQHAEMRVAGSDVRVSTERRADLEIPFAYGAGGRPR